MSKITAVEPVTEEATAAYEDKPFTDDMDALVPLRLNLLEQEGNGKIDQTVNVTRNGKTLVIRRGERVMIPKWAFIDLFRSGRFTELQ